MKKLEKKILINFILCAFVLSVLESVKESLFDDLLFPNYLRNNMNPDKTLAVTLLILYFASSVVLFIAAAAVFCMITKKAVRAESERRVREQNLLYSSIAHDLKTPMTSVQGFAQALRDGKVKPQEEKEILDIIYNKSKRMNELINEVFEYSKLGTQEYTPVFKRLNICTLVRELVCGCFSEFENRGMALNIDIDENEIICMADKTQLSRAVENLLVNAYKHNTEGTSVMIRVHQKNSEAEITVADTGEKIPEELLQNLFDPFVCADRSRTTGTGSGLGLAVCKKIIEIHKGRVYLNKNIKGYTKGFTCILKTADE